MQENQLGWVTNLSITNKQDLIDVTSWGDGGRRKFIPSLSYITGSLEFTATHTQGVQELLQDWLNNGITSPRYKKEFRCLYCTSPNSVELTHCKKCGAPRSFILG